MSLVLVSTVTVGSGGASTISFASIPAAATDLYLVLNLRSSWGSQVNMVINSDTDAANYAYRRLFGTGSAASSAQNDGSYGYAILVIGATAPGDTASTFSNSSIYIPNYTSTTAKSISVDGVTENNATAAYQILQANLYRGTSAITNITLSQPAGTFDQYSTASLYTITKGSGGATVS